MQIPLTQGYYAEIDFSDWHKVQGYTWRAAVGPHTVYAATGSSGNNIYMHRLIKPPPLGMETDHIDGNGINNRYNNLRHATHRQNLISRKTESASGYRGVSLTRSGRWQAQLDSRKARRYLGAYDTAEEAARAWDEAAKELYGEFAVLNFP